MRSAPLVAEPGLDPHTPIFAVATPAGAGARAVVRLSGPSLLPTLAAAWPAVDAMSWRQPKAEQIEIVVPGLSLPLPVRFVAWPAPRSFTAQDVVELHLVSSAPLLAAVVAGLKALGVRPARPGEFTLRAFLAGKLNLVQAESIHALVQARTPADLAAAWDRYTGGLGSLIARLREDLLLVLAEVEASLDFADEDLSFLSKEELRQRVLAANSALRGWQVELTSRGQGDPLPIVVLAGHPNAGKSSLFNALLKYERALVSPEAGTTRDAVSHLLDLDGLSCDLHDTAGWMVQCADEVEEQAQAQALVLREQADLLIWCQPAHQPVAARPQLPATVPLLAIWTQVDRLPAGAELPGEGLRTSAVRGDGLDALRHEVRKRLEERTTSSAAGGAGQAGLLLAETSARLQAAAELLAADAFPELVALELRSALAALAPIAGTAGTEELLDRVFGQFCIGK